MDQTELGYAIFERIFEQADMASLLDALAGARLARTKAGVRHVLRVPVVRGLAGDERPAAGSAKHHRDGVLTDAQIERLARTVQPVDCVAKAGEVVAMRPLTVHASSKSVDDKPRRVLHIEYADSLHLSSGIELAVA